MIDQETATDQFVADYRVNGQKLVAQMVQFHQEEYGKFAKVVENANAKMVKQLANTIQALDQEKNQMAGWRDKLSKDEKESTKRGKENPSGVAKLLAQYGGV